jgi:hypothetical protein
MIIFERRHFFEDSNMQFVYLYYVKNVTEMDMSGFKINRTLHVQMIIHIAMKV